MPSESSADAARWSSQLREALIALALPPPEQVRVTQPGCVSCELLDDFEFAKRDYLEYCPSAGAQQQRYVLDKLDRLIEAMEEPDYECWNNDVLKRPAWEEVRGAARQAIAEFGWTGQPLASYEQVNDGVWFRPPSDDE